MLRWPLFSLTLAILAAWELGLARAAQIVFTHQDAYQINTNITVSFTIPSPYLTLPGLTSLGLFQWSQLTGDPSFFNDSGVLGSGDPRIQTIATTCAGYPCAVDDSTGLGNVTFIIDSALKPQLDLSQKYYYGMQWTYLNTSISSPAKSLVNFYSDLFTLSDSPQPSNNPAIAIPTPTPTSSASPNDPQVGQANGNNPSVASPSPISASVQSSNSGLSTGAKVGIGVGVGVAGGLLLFGALFIFWRRYRSRNRGVPMAYAHAVDGADGDSQAEKEMNVINTNSATYTPVDRHDHGFEDVPLAAPSAQQPIMHAHEPEEESRWEEEQQHVPTPPPAPQQNVSQAAGFPTSSVDHLREPGMGPEELARLEDEERRLDEAIAEAEQRRRPSEV